MKHQTASEWMRQHGLSWSKAKQAPTGKNAKHASTQAIRRRRANKRGDPLKKSQTIKAFVEAVASASRKSECVFVPAAQKGVPAIVWFCGKNISAARYACLLAMGAPKSDGLVVRHHCGNGDLSCVNPDHLSWGTQGDNIADANKHRSAGDHTQDKINAIT
jgi:hypothetical protein